ncbi:MAG: flagellar biosynthesis repressor FlbT [Stellaceae bacterium]
MPLTINLKPGEKLIVNGVVLQNAHHAAKLVVHNEAALLREKDIITEEAATTPARRIYFTVQCLYLFPAKSELYLPIIHRFLAEFSEAAPSALPLLRKIEQELAADQLYPALKTAKQLIAKEQEILDGATGTEIQEATGTGQSGKDGGLGIA